MLWQFFFLRGIENGIEYRYFSRYRIEVRNSSIVTTLHRTHFLHVLYESVWASVNVSKAQALCTNKFSSPNKFNTAGRYEFLLSACLNANYCALIERRGQGAREPNMCQQQLMERTATTRPETSAPRTGLQPANHAQPHTSLPVEDTLYIEECRN